MAITIEQIMSALNLQPHPTCGFVAESYRSTTVIPDDGLPAAFGGPRPLGSVLNFMVTTRAHIRLHRIRNDQMYHQSLRGRPEVPTTVHSESENRARQGEMCAAALVRTCCRQPLSSKTSTRRFDETGSRKGPVRSTIA
jgi:predicted cupin superfamily sugar epimerase